MRFQVLVFTLAAVFCATVVPASPQEVTKDTLDGVTNFNRLGTTVACTGAIKTTAIPELKKMGFASIINLRQATENGADLEGEAAAAKAANIRYYSIPLSVQMPDSAVIDKFLDAITTPGSEPAFIHCAGGGRAATMWFVKRVVVDHWDLERATKEATALGMPDSPLRKFATDYAQTHKR